MCKTFVYLFLDVVLLVDVENKDIIHKTNYGEDAKEPHTISCLVWLEEKSDLTGTSQSKLVQVRLILSYLI